MDFLRLDISHIILALLFSIIIAVLIIQLLKRQKWLFGNTDILNYKIDKKKQKISASLMASSFVLLILSLLGPVIYSAESNSKTQWIDVVWILDVSKSMDAEDVSIDGKTISRLAWSKAFIQNFIERNNQNRDALVVFAGDAQIISPITSDESILDSFISSINTTSVRQGGSDIGKAMMLALWLKSSESYPKNFVLITDGWEEDVQFWNKLPKSEIGSFTIIGVWEERGAKIPIGSDFFWNTIYKKYQGEDVITRLNESGLKKYATDNNGTYIDGGVKARDQLNNLLDNQTRHIINQWGLSDFIDLGRFFSLGALLLFLGSYIISSQKRAWESI